MYKVVVGHDALAVGGCLEKFMSFTDWCGSEEPAELTSAEHFATALANLWIGRGFGCIVSS